MEIRTGSNIKCHIKLEEGIMLFLGNSGTGKTLLFEHLYTYFNLNDISNVFFDYKFYGLDKGSIIANLKGKKVAVFDNADLYLDREIVQAALDFDVKYILIAVKNIHNLIPSGVKNCAYRINFQGNTLEAVRVE